MAKNLKQYTFVLYSINLKFTPQKFRLCKFT